MIYTHIGKCVLVCVEINSAALCIHSNDIAAGYIYYQKSEQTWRSLCYCFFTLSHMHTPGPPGSSKQNQRLTRATVRNIWKPSHDPQNQTLPLSVSTSSNQPTFLLLSPSAWLVKKNHCGVCGVCGGVMERGSGDNQRGVWLCVCGWERGLQGVMTQLTVTWLD